MKAPRKRKVVNKNPDLHNELKGFDISINTFGEMETTFDIERINQFLDKNILSSKPLDDEEE